MKSEKVSAVYGSKKGLQYKGVEIHPKAKLPREILKFYEPFDWKRVDVVVSGWCGSDSHFLESIRNGKEERILGHEAIVFDPEAKKYAAVIIPVGCTREDCEPCIKGVRQHCSIDACAVEFAGIQGIHSKEAFLPKRCLMYQSKKFTEEELLRAPFYDPLSDVIAAIDGLEAGFKAIYSNTFKDTMGHFFSKVFVIGAGNIGFLSAAYVRELFSHTKILLTDIKFEDSFKANFVKAINADYAQTQDGKNPKERKRIAQQTAEKVNEFFNGFPSLVVWAATPYDGYLASEVSGQLTAHSVLSVGPENYYESGFNLRKAVSHKSLIFASSGASNEQIQKAIALVRKWKFLNDAVEVVKM